MAEKAEWKFGRKLEILDQEPPAIRENMLAFDLGGLVASDMDKMI